MNRTFLSVFIILLFGFLSVAHADNNYAERLPKYLEMLRKGKSNEKKLALHSLWFLEYGEFRKDKNVFDPIVEALKDKDASVREAAAECLKVIGREIQEGVDEGTWSKNCCRDTAIVPSLINALEDEKSRVRAEVAKALGMYRSDRRDRYVVDKEERAIAPLIKALKDRDPWVILNAAFSLGELRTPKAIESLAILLEDDSDWRNKFLQQEAITAIRKIGVVDNKIISLFIQKSEDPFLRAEIIETLATLPSVAAREVLLKASNDPNERIRKSAMKALSRLPVMYNSRENYENKKNEILEKSLKDPSVQIRLDSINNLVRYEKSLIPLLSNALTDNSNEVKLKAIEALGKIIDGQILYIMISFIESNEDSTLVSKANETFRNWTERNRKKVYIYRKDEQRYVIENRNDVPKGTDFSSRFIDEKIASKLIEKSNSNPSKFLGLLSMFEDERIEPILIKSLDSQSVPVREIAVRSLSIYSVKNVPRIIKLLKDPDAKVRTAAVITLGEIRDKRALDSIIERLDDTDSWVRTFAKEALSKFEDPRQVELYIKLLQDKDGQIRSGAAAKLAEKNDKRAVEPLISLLNDPHEAVPRQAAHALGKIGDKRALEPLIKALNGEFNRNRMFAGDTELRKSAAGSLGLLGDKKAMPALTNVALNQKEDSRLRYSAANALIRVGGPAGVEIVKSLLYEEKFYEKFQLLDEISKIDAEIAVSILIDFLNSDDNVRVSNAANMLGRLKSGKAIRPLVKTAGRNKTSTRIIADALRGFGDPAISDMLIGYLDDKDLLGRKGAIMILSEFREKKSLEPLKSLLEDKDPEVKALAKDAISKIESASAPKPGMINGQGPMPLRRGMESGNIQPGPWQPHNTPLKREPEIVVAQSVKSVDIRPLIAGLKDKDAKVRRGAADAMGDSGNIGAPEHLIPVLKDSDAYVRQAAARALGKLKGKEGVSALIDSINDSDINVRSFSVWALGEIKDNKAIEPIADLLLDKDEKIRDQSFDALRKYTDPLARRVMVKKLIDTASSTSNTNTSSLLGVLTNLEGEQVILKALEDPEGNDLRTIRNYLELLDKHIIFFNNDLPKKVLKEHKNRDLVLSEISAFIKNKADDTPSSTIYIYFLGHLKDPKGLPILLDIVNAKRESDSKLAAAKSEHSRRAAVTALGELGDKGASNNLLDILGNSKESYAIRKDAAQALGKIGEEKAAIPLMEILKSNAEDKDLRIGALLALGDLNESRAVDTSIEILKDTKEHLSLRCSAASYLGKIGDNKAIEPLKEVVKDKSTHDYLQNAAEVALRKFNRL